MKPSHFKGLYTAMYRVPDLAQAKAWYASLFGIEPYFDHPSYVGFNIAGYELGLLPNEPGAATGPGGLLVYWGVDKMSVSWPRLLSLGATEVEKPQDVGEGIFVATARDPFGNLIGVIENPHFPNTA
ncbi:MAG: VOC family protein [Candidatus Eisenbacteria bacterium]|uniref:VOC family protein n=1 Tax=Eiseniibacteriota bacterium TaxID=2212470 RepID=A0A849SWV8_UNCEI|nr:VOC family protein [Candidatus Eisenbacteria bacterium]